MFIKFMFRFIKIVPQRALIPPNVEDILRPQVYLLCWLVRTELTDAALWLIVCGTFHHLFYADFFLYLCL